MTRGGATDTGVDWRSRMWWLAPLCVVASTAIAVTVLMAPRLGAHVAVPRMLVVATPATVTQPAEPPRATQRPSPHRPSPLASPSPVRSEPAPTTQIVQPQLPVVTVTQDSTDRGSESEPGDR